MLDFYTKCENAQYLLILSKNLYNKCINITYYIINDGFQMVVESEGWN